MHFDPLDDVLDTSLECGMDDDDGLEGIFGDIVGAVGKIATAPIDLVASALPKPVGKALKSISPTHQITRMMKKGAGVADRATGQGRKRRVSAKARAAAAKRRKKSKSKRRKSSSRGMGSTEARLMETMVKMLGTKDIMATLKPRLAAKSSGKAGKPNAALVTALSLAVKKQMAPELNNITKKLQLAENQRIATSEHNAINNEKAFRRQVLKDLVRISTNLPANHPTRVRIRKVGLMSGLL